MYCGVPYELFWHLNPKKLEPFYEAEKLRADARENRDNRMAWLIGLYFTHSIASMLPKSRTKYPNTPIDFNAKPNTDAERFAEWAKEHNKAKAEKRRRGI